MPSNRPRRRRPSAPMLVALLALFVALGGPAQAARLIDGSRIERGTITSKQVKDRSIKPRDLSGAAVRTLQSTPDDSITALKLGENSVTTRALAPGSVLTGIVGDNSITSTDLAPNSVRNQEMADDAIGQAEIRSNGVGASEIAIDAVDSGEVRDGGLSIRDVAREVGTFPLPVPTLDTTTTGRCSTVPVNANGIRVRGDFVLISPTSVWPPALVHTVNGTGSETQFKVQVCNHGTSPVPGATYQFNYAVLGY